MKRLFCLSLSLVGCASTGGAVAGPSPFPEASTGVADATFARLLERHWAAALEEDPLGATELGVHAFDDRIEDLRPQAIASRQDARRRLRDELAALLPTLTSTSDALSGRLLLGTLDQAIAGEVCRFHEWSLSASHNPVTQWNYLPELHTVKSYQDAENLLARYAAIAGAIDQDIANLRTGLAAGRVANAETVVRVTAMVTAQLAQAPAEWPLIAPAHAEHPEWSAEQRAAFAAQLTRTVDEAIRPALARYLALLEKEIAPAARPSDRTGVGALPDGEACYRAQIGRFTGLALEPKAVHETGLAEIERLDRAIAELGARVLGTTDLPSTLARLREDKTLYFDTAAAIEAKARDVLARAQAATPRYFGILPKAACVVTRVPDYEAPFSTIAYYRPPVPDGSKPGQYFVNVYQPETRPRYEAAVLAVHESVPGHHLQIAIAQERPALAEFRKHLDSTAFVEGWALYTERLAEEMGLYQDDLDRLGALSFDAWRASRLVVDTGIHALGWSREQAVAFMLAHTALAPNNVSNEVDRYIGWPAQALAYKTGQREISRLRAEAESRLGERFVLSEFHDVVLGQGAVSLPVLGETVEAWIARKSAAPSPQ